MTGNHIVVRNLKGVSYLDFEMPSSGVHVITAANGNGKTTLLHCIEFLKNRRAFRENFTQHDAWNVDSFLKSTVTYKSHTQSQVTYSYRQHLDSWRPMSQTVSETMAGFNYQEINAIPTLGLRVYIQKSRIRGGYVKAAPASLRTALVRVMDNTKFEKLLKYKIGETRGRGGSKRRKNIAFMLPKGFQRMEGRRAQTYYSESNFSLGEIFALNLLYAIENIEEDSLLIIDELEVALHPMVQKNLLEYIEKRAEEKNLTVLVSTHSSTLIKCAKNLIYLQNNGEGSIEVKYKCYPAIALREIAVEEDMQPDCVMYVEDVAAEMFLREKIKYYFSLHPDRQQPIWKILPIGGYSEVLRFTERVGGYLLPRAVTQFAFLDQDVLEVRNELRRKANNRTEAENEIMRLFTSLENQVKYLSITPELGLWQWFSTEIDECQRLIYQAFPDARLRVSELVRQCSNAVPNQANNPRKSAKKSLSWITEAISANTNQDKARVRQHLYGAYVRANYVGQDGRNYLNQTFGPVFNN